MCGLCDHLHRKTLAGVILDPAKQDQRDFMSVAFYGTQDVCKPERVFTTARVHFKNGIFGVEPMECGLRGKGVLNTGIGGKILVKDMYTILATSAHLV